MLQAIFELLFELLFQVICHVTGELILWIVTLGHRRPFQSKKDGDLMTLSTLIGLLFWILIAVVFAMVFFL